MKRIIITMMAFLYAVVGYATEYKPWFGNYQEFEFRGNYEFQKYTKIHSDNGRIRYPSSDDLVNLSLSMVPYIDWDGEIELGAASTREHSFGVDNIRFTVRHLFSNDIVGDDASIVGGFSTTLVTKDGKRDVSTYHNGDIDLEAHISIGKERSSGKYWLYRYWGNLGYIIANKGSPTVRGELAWERNIDDVYRWKFFSDFAYGIGQKAVSVPFNGYGSIRNRDINVGIRYGYNFGYNGMVTAEYKRRVYAHNAPEHCDTFTIGYEVSFSPYSVTTESDSRP